MKSLTLSILPLSGGGAFQDGKFLSATHGPTKDQGSPKNAGAVFTPATPAALCPRRALAITFSTVLQFLFLFVHRSPQGLSDICFVPSLFSLSKKKKDSKSEISTINFQSMLHSFSLASFFLLTPTALWLLWPAFLPV